MESGKYLFGLVFFFAFLTVLIIFVMPVGPGNSKTTCHFGIQPDESIHYAQVIGGTNTTAVITIENTLGRSYDLINWSFKASVYADITVLDDIKIVSQLWDNNFTILKGQVKTLKLYFNATYPHTETRGFYIKVWWGEDSPNEDSARFADLNVGLEFKQASFFTLETTMILISSIGMGLVLFVLVFATKKDIKNYRKKPAPRKEPTPAPPSPAEPTPSIASVPSPTVLLPPTTPSSEPLPIETMELMPCPKCGSKVDTTQVVCPNCGYEIPKCAICNLIIEEADETETCPNCGATGHRAHFREWVHIKGTCPICKKTISFD